MHGKSHFLKRLEVKVNIIISCGSFWQKSVFIEIRSKEQFLLEMAAYIQSVSVALAPVIPIIAVIVTFLTYIGSGHDLSPSQVH